jgi:hypothetical protein
MFMESAFLWNDNAGRHYVSSTGEPDMADISIAWRLLPLIGVTLLVAIPFGWRSWLQRRRHGGRRFCAMVSCSSCSCCWSARPWPPWSGQTRSGQSSRQRGRDG